jgi:hypothetical protein
MTLSLPSTSFGAGRRGHESVTEGSKTRAIGDGRLDGAA